MKREVILRLLVDSPVDEDRLLDQIEAVFEFGTIREAIAEGLKLDVDPSLVSVQVRRPVRRRE